jgi:hypothetical protein
MQPDSLLILDALLEVPSVVFRLSEGDINKLLARFMPPAANEQVHDLAVHLESEGLAVTGRYAAQDIAFEARCQLFTDDGRLAVRLADWRAGSGAALMNSLLRLGKFVDRLTGAGRGWLMSAVRTFTEGRPELSVRPDEAVVIDLGRLLSNALRAHVGIQLAADADLQVRLLGIHCEPGRLTAELALGTIGAARTPLA